MSRERPGLRRAVRGAGIVGVVMAVVTVRVVVGAYAEHERGKEAAAAKDLEGARLHWRRAAGWYAPLNPYSTKALDELATLARMHQERTEIDQAVLAWRAVRSAILSARSVHLPHRDRLAEANERIAELMVQQERSVMDGQRDDEELEGIYASQLRAVPGPHMGWALLAIAGFAVWVSAAFSLSQRGFDADDRWLPAPGRRHLLTIALGWAAFAIGLWQA